MNFRQLYRYMVPGWLRNGDGGRILYALATIVDASAERMSQARGARFPSRAGASALAKIQLDRGLVRGRTETTDHFRARLKAFRHPRGHRVRGSAFALLEQVAEYLGGTTTSAWTISANGTRHDRAADGTESYSYGNAWTWDSVAATEWGRFWINLDSDDLTAQAGFGATLWGGSIEAPDETIGIAGMTPYDAAALRGLMRGRWPWRPAGTTGQWLIVSIDGSDVVPDVSYAKWGELYLSNYIPARSSDHRYIHLAADRETYAGDPTVFAETIQPDNLANLDGDDTSFPSTITLPDGRSYAGNSASFPTTITLVDDGV